MNRKIKFRAWDKHTNSMVHELEWISLEQGNIKKIGYIDLLPDEEGDLEWERVVSENFELMQFTGFVDKNGKEIYEGDIVYFESGTPNRADEDDGMFCGGVSEVKFENGAFFPRPIKEECEDPWYDYEVRNLEIIGNVWENPELLNTN